jgi:hypothetical protein
MPNFKLVNSAQTLQNPLANGPLFEKLSPPLERSAFLHHHKMGMLSRPTCFNVALYIFGLLTPPPRVCPKNA